MNLNVNAKLAPHIMAGTSIPKAMKDVLFALLPIYVVAIYLYGANASLLVATCLSTATFTELCFRAIKGKKHTLSDGSALVTGALIAMSLPGNTHWWVGALGTFIAVGLVKELGGGLGWNRLNPALAGRVCITVMSWLFLEIQPVAVDVVSAATPLARLQQGMAMPNYLQMFTGVPAGAIAESSALAVLIGGLYLLYKGHINWRMPVSILGTVFLLSLTIGQNPIYQVLTGGLMLGAFFMATDWVTGPISSKGKLFAGIFIGVMVVFFRAIPFTTEGVAFAILLMNLLVPKIDELTRNRTFGHTPIQQWTKAPHIEGNIAAKGKSVSGNTA